MFMRVRRVIGAAVAAAAVCAWIVPPGVDARLQAPAAPSAPAGRGAAPQAPAGRGRATFPAQQRAPGDPALIQRGRSIYSVSCTSCHGADLRGGQLGGPNLLRSPVVLSDDLATLLVPILAGGRADKGMPAIPLAADDVTAVATYLHSVLAQGRGQGAPPPGPPVVLNVLVGDAAAGARYFSTRCASCHSVTGDLQGIGSRVPDPKALQNLWVAGGSGRSNAPRRVVTVRVVRPGAPPLEGRLVKIDDFIVTIALADGRIQSVARESDNVPTITITDPLAAHRELLGVYSNADMHDVTAYLSTLK